MSKCTTTFNESNLLVEKYNKISSTTKQSVVKELEMKSSFKDAASRINISSNTLRRITKTHCNQPRRKLPEVLSIDEFKGNAGNYKYQVLLADPINKTIIDVLPCRYKSSLSEYFNNIPIEERLKVKILITDMWDTYKDIGISYFPNAKIVADVFHFVRHVYWAMNNTRVRIMRKFKKGTEEYFYIKKFWKLLIKNGEDLSYEMTYNKRLKCHLSQVTIVDYCLNLHPELQKAYELKEEFFNIVKHSTHDRARYKLLEWISKCDSGLIHEFRDASKTINNWLDEIVNSFLIDSRTNKKYTNGFIEGTNNYIKSLKRMSYGFKDFFTFRLKIMYQHKNSEHKVTA